MAGLVGRFLDNRSKLVEQAASGDIEAQKRLRSNKTKVEALKDWEERADSGDRAAKQKLKAKHKRSSRYARDRYASEKEKREAGVADAIARHKATLKRDRERRQELKLEREAKALGITARRQVQTRSTGMAKPQQPKRDRAGRFKRAMNEDSREFVLPADEDDKQYDPPVSRRLRRRNTSWQPAHPFWLDEEDDAEGIRAAQTAVSVATAATDAGLPSHRAFNEAVTGEQAAAQGAAVSQAADDAVPAQCKIADTNTPQTEASGAPPTAVRGQTEDVAVPTPPRTATPRACRQTRRPSIKIEVKEEKRVPTVDLTGDDRVEESERQRLALQIERQEQAVRKADHAENVAALKLRLLEMCAGR